MELYRKYFNNEGHEMSSKETNPDWGVTVRTVGHNIHKPHEPYPDPGHPNKYYFEWNKGRILDEFQLIYVSKGGGIFEAEGVKPTTIEAGTVFLLFPKVWHRYKPFEETGWEEFWVGFTGQYAEYLMRQDCFKKETPFVQIGFNAELLNVFIQLIETIKYQGAAYHQLASCMITQLLGLFYSAALMTDVHRQNKNKQVHIARYKMHDNLHQSLDMEELAKELNVSYTWFRKAFKETMGISPGQYHLNIRIDKARKLLRDSNLTVTQISHTLGFESEFYFSRIFKKKVGLAPGQYRTKILG
jgi:AraC-like DNA-binding protein